MGPNAGISHTTAIAQTRADIAAILTMIPAETVGASIGSKSICLPQTAISALRLYTRFEYKIGEPNSAPTPEQSHYRDVIVIFEELFLEPLVGIPEAIRFDLRP